MSQHEAYRNKRTSYYWAVAAGIVYLTILVARVWGAHRFLHFEESAMVGASRTLPITAVWDDHAYGFVWSWILSEIASIFDIALMPIIFVSLATLTWLASALWMFFVLIRTGISNMGAFCGPLALCLLPLPDVAYIGIVSSVGFPLAVAMISTVSLVEVSSSRRMARVELLLIILIAASTPPALVGAGVAALYCLLRKGSIRANLIRLACILLGAVVSIMVFKFQDPQMAYLGEWVPTGGYERDVLQRLTEAGAFITRERASVGVVQTLRNIPGTLRFVITQFYPEPWASRAILETGGVAKLLQVVLPLSFVAVIVTILCRMRNRKIDSPTMRAAIWLFIAAAISVAVQHLLVGQLTLRQYLFLPLALFWMGVLVLMSGAVVARSGRAVALLAPLVIVFIFAAAQNFRDPFQENPRQGGTGRYAATDLWRPAIQKAREACTKLDDDAVVVISQFNQSDEIIEQMSRTSGLKKAWFDHSFVARCRVIADR